MQTTILYWGNLRVIFGVKGFCDLRQAHSHCARDTCSHKSRKSQCQDQVLSVAPTDEVREHRRYVLNMPSKATLLT